MHVRNHLFWTLAIAAVLLASPVSAQKISFGGDPTGQYFTAANEVPAFVIDVSNAETTAERIILGRADTLGPLDANVDLWIVDPDSTHLSTDTSLFFDASLSRLSIGSGTFANPGNPGTVHVENGLGNTTISLFGSTGNVHQDINAFDHTQGNGFLKGWAMIDGDGTVNRCWNCNTSTATQRLETGKFEVDFALGDISNRAYLAVIGCADPEFFGGQCAMDDAIIEVNPRHQDASSVYVEIENLSGAFVNRSFTVFVF